ncbi:MAG TPA: RluA family pseudouridine synthase [bacterium]|nr:RluA family pseudouridine synthase [bacterium]
MKEIVFNQEKNTRIDKYLKEKLNVSRERIKYLIKQEKVIVNSKKIIPSYHLKKGDLISIIQIEEEQKEEIKPEKSNLEIIYEDKNIIVVNKPAGIITHPTNYKKTGTLLNYVLYYTSLAKIGSPLRIGVVHRLDKETSGVIVFAKTSLAYWNLIEQFRNRMVEKIYLAIVKGNFTPEKKVIEFTVLPDKENPTKMKVHFLKGKKTITEINALKYFDDYTLVSVKPITGRTHQIRLTLSYLNYPIIGDEKYGVKSPIISRCALHAWKLTLANPRDNKKQTFIASIPDDIIQIINNSNL